MSAYPSIYFLSFASLLLLNLNCGDSGTPVGEGEPFSTLADEPTGDELFTAFTDGIENSSGLIIISPRLNPRNATRAATASDTSELECQGGGRIVRKLTSTQNETSASSVTRTTYEDCDIEMVLGGSTFSETINGSTTWKLSVNVNNLTSNVDWGLTVSGDLGFALVCDLGTSGAPGETHPFDLSGDCTFRDAEDTRIIKEF